MREIKFRVYCFADDKKQMIVLENGQFDNGYWFNCPAKIVHIDEYLSPLMQFTGKKDKNKKEIYQGDIVKIDWKDERYKSCYAVVKWDDEKACFDFGGGAVSEISWSHEVIGNIYEEDPKLTEQIK